MARLKLNNHPNKSAKMNIDWMIEYDDTGKNERNIPWPPPDQHQCVAQLYQDIACGELLITEKLMQRLRHLPELKKTVMHAIFLKQAGVKNGEDAGSTD